VSRMQTTGASQYVVERRSLVRVLVAAHDCRRPQVLLYLAAVRDGPSPNGVVCPVWLTAIVIMTNNVTMPAMTTTRTIHAPTPSSDGYGGGWAIASSYRRLHTWQVASLGLNSGLSRYTGLPHSVLAPSAPLLYQPSLVRCRVDEMLAVA
jgi:hypothetical protein